MLCNYWNCKKEFIPRAKNSKYCSSKCKNIVMVHNRRKKLKVLSVQYKGSKCSICGYDKCIEALEFHHIDPTIKEFSISVDGNTRSFEEIKKELDKCMLVCSNCHKEIHAVNKIGV